MTRNSYTRSRTEGLSLVELMVAVTIGAILLAGTVTLFVSNKSAYEVTSDLSLLQENARFAIQTIIQDMRHAGYFGCSDDFGEVNNVTGNTNGELSDPTNAIEGLDQAAATWSPSGANVPADIVAGTDALTIRYLSSDVNDVTAGGSATNTPVAATAGLEVGDYVGVSNCVSTDILKINNIAANTLIHAGLAGNYQATADTQPTVAPLRAVRYYVGNGDNGPSLFREILAGPDQEIVAGVENMQLLFGVDTNNDGAPDTYLVAGDANLDDQAEWANVVSVRIGLLMRTVDEYGTDVDSELHNVNGTVIGPINDRRRRRVFTTTALLRNLQ